MKKILITFTLLTSLFSYAQQEIKLDISDALVFKAIEFSYENYIDTESSIGVSVLLNFTNRNTALRYGEDKMITPYFRHYFSSNQQWNNFGEVFFGLNFGEKKIASTGNPTTYKSYTDGALGVAVGRKYTSKSGLTIDFHVGVGRNLFSSFSPILVLRTGLNIGYQF